mmetsp:Transcript_3457/g.9856  ORF Transcript_3457/g.9856 Transcript_3457/m.9856 type:complete len:325 (+) Transcript_3457:1226-2200(+)
MLTTVRSRVLVVGEAGSLRGQLSDGGGRTGLLAAFKVAWSHHVLDAVRFLVLFGCNIHNLAMVVNDEVRADLRNQLRNHVGVQSPKGHDEQVEGVEVGWQEANVGTLDGDSEGGQRNHQHEDVDHRPLRQPIQPNQDRPSLGDRNARWWDEPKRQGDELLGIRPQSGQEEDHYSEFSATRIPNVDGRFCHAEFEELLHAEGFAGQRALDVDRGSQTEVAAHEETDVANNDERHRQAKPARHDRACEHRMRRFVQLVLHVAVSALYAKNPLNLVVRQCPQPALVAPSDDALDEAHQEGDGENEGEAGCTDSHQERNVGFARFGRE